MSKIKKILKLFTITSGLLMLLGSFPLFSEVTRSPVSTVDANAGLVDDIKILDYDCIFPEKFGSDKCPCIPEKFGSDKCPNGGGDAMMSAIVDYLINISGVVAVLVIVWGGYRYYLGTISEDKEGGIKTIKSGIKGLLFVIFSKTIVTLLENTFTDDKKFNTEAVFNVVKDILGVVIPLASVVAVAFLVYGGYFLITAGSSEDRNKKGKQAIKNALIGLIVVLLATTFVQLINVLFKGAAEDTNLILGLAQIYL